jgi:trehalose-phosphatase
MDILNREISLDSFFNELKSAKHRILMLDYDGTLSPFTIDRDKAVPYPGISDILEKIISESGTRLIIISGRPINILKRLLNMKRQPEMWGSHGAERYSQQNGYSTLEPSNSTLRALDSIREWSVMSKLDSFMERKPFGVAYHWRGLSDEEKRKIKKTVEGEWKSRLSEYNLELHGFDGGLEIRYKGINKGSAVDSIFQDYTEDFIAAYLGDDLTDEDAFKALGDRGLKILVRKERRPTAADVILSPPEELLDFLTSWHKSAG